MGAAHLHLHLHLHVRRHVLHVRRVLLLLLGKRGVKAAGRGAHRAGAVAGPGGEAGARSAHRTGAGDSARSASASASASRGRDSGGVSTSASNTNGRTKAAGARLGAGAGATVVAAVTVAAVAAALGASAGGRDEAVLDGARAARGLHRRMHGGRGEILDGRAAAGEDDLVARQCLAGSCALTRGLAAVSAAGELLLLACAGAERGRNQRYTQSLELVARTGDESHRRRVRDKRVRLQEVDVVVTDVVLVRTAAGVRATTRDRVIRCEG